MIGATISTRAEALFWAHLDLAPLRGRRRGNIYCIFHDGDTHPSLSVDLDRGLFHCFACGVGGGLRRFAELVGEAAPSPARPARPRSLLAEAMARARHEADRQRRRLEPYCDLFKIADWVRARFSTVSEARRVATRLGDTERSWEILDLTARVEREALAAGAGLDSLLPLPRQEDLDGPLGGWRP